MSNFIHRIVVDYRKHVINIGPMGTRTRTNYPARSCPLAIRPTLIEPYILFMELLLINLSSFDINRTNKCVFFSLTRWMTYHINIPVEILHSQVLNLLVIIMYRWGLGGDFLGSGGTWNLNEEKNPDVEIVASGVFVGFFIYTSVQLIAYCFGTTQHKRWVEKNEISSF